MLDIKTIILDAGKESLKSTIPKLNNFLTQSYNIRFSERDIKKIFKTYQTYSSYRYEFKLEKLINNNSSIKSELENMCNDSSFVDYQTRILESIMEYLKTLNKFNWDFNDNYFQLKKQISNFVKDNYYIFLNICHNNLIAAL